MKNIYNLFFSLDNLSQNENFIINLYEIEDKNNKDNKFLEIFFKKTIIAPKQELVDEIIHLVKKGKI